MPRTYKKSMDRIAKKLTTLLRKRIKQLDLIDTGLMYDSIEVVVDSGTSFSIITTDYFKYVDGNYDIIDYVLNSKEFTDYAAESLTDDIEISLEELFER